MFSSHLVCVEFLRINSPHTHSQLCPYPLCAPTCFTSHLGMRGVYAQKIPFTHSQICPYPLCIAACLFDIRICVEFLRINSTHTHCHCPYPFYAPRVHFHSNMQRVSVQKFQDVFCFGLFHVYADNLITTFFLDNIIVIVFAILQHSS